jgi:hypothetical protein
MNAMHAAAARATIGAALAAILTVIVAASPSAQKDDKRTEAQRPKLALHAQPSVVIAPGRVVLTAELTGGSDDFEEYYCPTVVWEWGDLTSSESTLDCAPYEAGKTPIKRRFTVDHKFDRAGSYKVYFRMKRGSKELTATSVTVKVQPGRDITDP